MYPLQIGDLVSLVCWCPLYTKSQFYLGERILDISPSEIGIIVDCLGNSMEPRTIRIFTAYGPGWVSEHVLKPVHRPARKGEQK